MPVNQGTLLLDIYVHFVTVYFTCKVTRTNGHWKIFHVCSKLTGSQLSLLHKTRNLNNNNIPLIQDTIQSITVSEMTLSLRGHYTGVENATGNSA